MHNTPNKLGDCVMRESYPYIEVARRLYEVARSQQGFFTTKQAIRAGFSEKVHTYHVKAGNWIREHRRNFIGSRNFQKNSRKPSGPDAVVSLVAKPAGSAPGNIQS